MSMMTVENADGILWLFGNIMPSDEKHLDEELRQYIQQAPKDARIVDMSGVKYISSSSAKALLTIAQETSSRGGKVKVRSSIPVVRTLNLLGAETWCDVEPCREPNRKPGAGTGGGGSRIMPAVPKGDSSSRIDPVAKRDSSTQLTPAGGSGTEIPPTLEDTAVKQALGERRSTVGLNAPGTSVVRGTVGQTAAEAALISSAAAKAGLPLVNEDADLPEDLAALKKLVVMKTYTFQMPGLKSDITGKVLARIGGPWVLIDTHGTKKMLNIREVAVIDILA